MVSHERRQILDRLLLKDWQLTDLVIAAISEPNLRADDAFVQALQGVLAYRQVRRSG